MRCIFAALSLAVWGASLAKSTAAGPPIQRMQPLSATLRLETGQRRTWRCLEGVRDLPRGGEQNEPSRVSVSPEETLPPGIAGASMMAFRAPVPVSQATHRTYDDETEETGDSEAPQATKADAHAHAHAHAHADLTIPPAPPSMLAKRLANLRERALPAILMLAVVGSIAKFLKEDGLIGLALLLQAGMYQETTRVVGGDFPHPFYKWWWFLTASVALNAPFILSWARQEIAAGAMGMAMFGIFSVIVRFNWKGAQVEEFRDFLRQAAVSFLASVSQLQTYQGTYQGTICQPHHNTTSHHVNIALILCCFVVVPAAGDAPVIVLDCHLGRVWNEMGGSPSRAGHHQ